MGHTLDLKRIVSRCDGKVIIIDTGITPAYGGILSALRIDYSLIPIKPDHNVELIVNATDSSQATLDMGTKPSKWRELEVVTAIYEDHKQRLATSEREIEGDFWI